MKNAAKIKNATIHIPKADVSYSHGTVLANNPQQTQELKYYNRTYLHIFFSAQSNQTQHTDHTH